ncbi:conserved hypothetical protein [Ricinus communis]|uniref:RNase H type-1 domain-containing protein n=1 Tax=Ricinus communis TaxID=3988 RepID=B9T376_RICCO|nr:conserved hypothetical protein [Ricinus communis]
MEVSCQKEASIFFLDNMFFACCWSLWLERNKFIFEGSSIAWEKLSELILIRKMHWIEASIPSYPFSVNEIMTSSLPLKRWRSVCSIRPDLQWLPPLANELKWNVYGSIIGKPGIAGIGGVLRNAEGLFIALFSCPIGIKDSNDAEVHAICKAFELTVQNGNLFSSNICAESDSKIAVGLVNGECDAAPFKHWNILFKIRSLR